MPDVIGSAPATAVFSGKSAGPAPPSSRGTKPLSVKGLFSQERAAAGPCENRPCANTRETAVQHGERPPAGISADVESDIILGLQRRMPPENRSLPTDPGLRSSSHTRLTDKRGRSFCL